MKKQKDLEWEYKRLSELKHGNAELLTNFSKNYTHKKKPISIDRKIRFLESMRKTALILNAPLNQFKGEQIIKVMKALETEQNNRINEGKKPFSLHTWQEYRKDLILWIKQVNTPAEWFAELNRKEVKDALEVENPYRDVGHAKKIKDQLLSQEETTRLLEVGNTMEKAVFSILAFCGLRPIELITLRPKSISFREDGAAKISLEKSKTRVRTLLLRADLSHYVANWVNERDSTIPWLFYNKGEQLDNAKLIYLMRSLAVKAGLGKWVKEKVVKGKTAYLSKRYEGRPLTPYVCRRTHITWAVTNMDAKMASKRAWGNLNSQMLSVYAGLTDEDAMENYDTVTNGGKPKEPVPQFAEGNFCGLCKRFYPATVSLCPEHRLPISIKALEAEERKTQELKELLLSELEGKLIERFGLTTK